MRHLIDFDSDYNLIINPDIYTLKPFREIWLRDKTKDKRKAFVDIGYVFWWSDFRSFMHDITDPEEKHREIVKLITDDENYKPDDVVKEAIAMYQKDLPLSLHFLTDVKVAINELRRYFRELDLSETDDKGKLVHNANQVMNSIKSTGDLLETLEKHETKVKKDIDLNNSVRGQKMKGLYED